MVSYNDGTMSLECILLGVAQDAGVPQAGCYCTTCANARANPANQHYTVCLGLIDRDRSACWMIDATPDFKHQHAALMAAAPGCEWQGIFLTHAHIGHYTGLIHLGKECMNARALPVHASARVCQFLCTNAPWSLLVRNNNIALIEIAPGQLCELGPGCSITALVVPHRDEFSDTVAYVIAGTQRSLFYCPDIDRWEDWGTPVRELCSTHNVSLIDGCFYDSTELKGRDMTLIPHPVIAHSMTVLNGLERDIRFVHLNHSNPVLTKTSAEYARVIAHGFGVGDQGDRWEL